MDDFELLSWLEDFLSRCGMGCEVQLPPAPIRFLREGVDFPAVPVKTRVRPLKSFAVESRDLPVLPSLSAGSSAEFERVARIRKLPHGDGPALAARHGVLRFCTAYDLPAWAVLDVENACNVQLRRMDGELWFGKTKVMGITGNWAAWPVGLSVALRMTGSDVWLVEGTGDFIAAWHCAADGWGNFVPVAMFGAANEIHAGALPLFSGRRVVIIGQNDGPGAAAAARWEGQLRAVASEVIVRMVPGDGADLNDWVADGGGDFVSNQAEPRHE
jgi:hypothetical protein